MELLRAHSANTRVHCVSTNGISVCAHARTRVSRAMHRDCRLAPAIEGVAQTCVSCTALLRSRNARKRVSKCTEKGLEMHGKGSRKGRQRDEKGREPRAF
eukprot:3073865-Rhodomonas_salina.1